MTGKLEANFSVILAHSFNEKVMKAVRFNHFGGIDVLEIVEVEKPIPGKGQMLVRIKAAGINPGESGIREGRFEKQWPTTMPSGQGSDLSGIVEVLGEGVSNFSVGAEIIGFTNNRASHAEFAVVESANAVIKPSKVSWEEAGGLFVAGTTAFAAVEAVSLQSKDIVVVSGAAGGVGSIAVQLAKQKGATVIGLASEKNHQWLSDHGVVPIAYGANMAEKIAQASASQPNAFIDTYGHGYVDLAMQMKISPNRINTIIDFEAIHKYGVQAKGSFDAARADVLTALADMIQNRTLDVPVENTYPLAAVQEAYRELEQRHTRGKIVLIP